MRRFNNYLFIFALQLFNLIVTDICYSEISFNYKPPFLPFSVSVNKAGITLNAERSIVTPIGKFSIGADYSLYKKNGYTIVVIRVLDNNKEYAFKIHEYDSKLIVNANGNTDIEIKDRCVLIYVKRSTQIWFNRSDTPLYYKSSATSIITNGSKFINTKSTTSYNKNIKTDTKPSNTGTGIYHRVDDAGIVHFTDAPMPGFERVKTTQLNNNRTGIYRRVDDAGIVHFTDAPIPGFDLFIDKLDVDDFNLGFTDELIIE